MWEHLRGVFVLSTLRGYGLIRSGVIVLVFLPFSLWIAPAAAFVPCELEEEIPKTRPPSADGQPTEIHVKFFLLDLVDVITVKQEFMVDLFYSATWKDSRVGALLRKAGIQSCEMALDQIWRPSMIALNDRASTTNLPQIFTVSDNGRVVSQQRLMGSFGTHFDLSEFPLDTQVLPITFVSTKYSLEELKVVLDASDSMERFTETGWTVEGTVANSSKFDLGVVQAQSQPHGLVRFDYKIQVKRQTIYYVWKVFLPLCMIVMVSWAVFWIHPSQLGIQTGIGTGMMLSLIAFLFSLQNILPKINYLTRMDLFVYSSLTFVFLAFIEAITSGRMAAQGKEQLALRIDLVSRFIFPCAFLGVVLWFWRIL